MTLRIEGLKQSSIDQFANSFVDGCLRLLEGIFLMVEKSIICPKCGLSNTIKYGYQKTKDDKKQRYKCLKCERIFLLTSDTIFHSRKMSKSKLNLMIKMMINETKLQTIIDVLDISSKTAYLWRMKIYKSCEVIAKSVYLREKVWIDEILVPVNKSQLIMKTEHLKYRGVSRNQIVVAVGIDVKGSIYAKVVGRGHITKKQVMNSYGKHIEPKSILIHDGIFSHDILVNELCLESYVYKAIVKSNRRYMQPINSLCAQIKRILLIHIGMKTERLQDYLNWIVFRSTLKQDDIDGKVNELVDICFQYGVNFRQKDLK